MAARGFDTSTFRTRSIRALHPVACIALAQLAAACTPSGPVSAHPDAFAAEPVDGAAPGTFPAIDAGAPPERTEDGVGVVRVTLDPPAREGDVAWIPKYWSTLDVLPKEASDGRSIYFATGGSGASQGDVLVRGGRLYAGVLATLAGATSHPGGCGAAAGGTVLLTGPSAGPKGENVWLLEPDGSVRTAKLPLGGAAACAAWLDDDGAYAVAGNHVQRWSAATGFVEEKAFLADYVHLGSAKGPRYCFDDCRDQDTSPRDDASLDALRAALGPCGRTARDHGFAALGDRVALACRDGVVARLVRGKPPEVLRGLPPSHMLGGNYDVALTPEGDVLVGLTYRMRRYVVWRSGAPGITPIRTLGPGEILSVSSPPLLLRGMSSPLPAADVAAVLLAGPGPYGTNGPTLAYVERGGGGEIARFEQAERARRVLPAGDLVTANEAVVELRCGAYVRSPVGWEGVEVHDWIPPKLPPLSPKAVYKPSACLALDSVAALPGDPDLLLARTNNGKLAVAWLPPPLPLPGGQDPRRPGGLAPPPEQHPVPGPGWVDLDAPVDGFSAELGSPAPTTRPTTGGGTLIVGPGHSIRSAQDPAERARRDRESIPWFRAGGTIVRAPDAEILLLPNGAARLPPGASPMAVMLGPKMRVLAALGPKLVVCDVTCRILDPGVAANLVTAVPRTFADVALTYADGRTGVYHVPDSGGEAVPDHAIAEALRRFLGTKPKG